MKAVSIRIDSVEKLIEVGERITGAMVFRGHGSNGWPLVSTLERAACRWGVNRTKLPEREKTVLNSFQRRAHHYINDPPKAEHLTEWAALLQHYGGPTRLLDVTRSYLVATFFAVEKAEDDGIVWAFNTGPLVPGNGLKGPTDPGSSTNKSDAVLAGREDSRGVILVEPFRMNSRLATQQGAFLMPLSLGDPFQVQLEQVMGCNLAPGTDTIIDSNSRENYMNPVWKIIIPRERHSDIVRFLSRSNITAATLFEGLEGFARSLHTGPIMRIYD